MEVDSRTPVRSINLEDAASLAPPSAPMPRVSGCHSRPLVVRVSGKVGGRRVATDIFAKLGDIKGESLDDKHKDEIEVLSWSWGVNQPGSMHSGGGGGLGKADFSDLSFTHYVDKASPVMFQACAGGEHIKEALLTVRKAGKTPQEFLMIKMNDVVITSV